MPMRNVGKWANDQTGYNNIRKRVMMKDYTHAALNAKREDREITMVWVYRTPDRRLKETSVPVRVIGSMGGGRFESLDKSDVET